MRRLLPFALLLSALAALTTGAAAQEQGWRITDWSSEITVLEAGDVRFVETITVDFGTLERHGIFRDLVTRQQCGEITADPEPLHECPGGSDRLYPVTVISVTDGGGGDRPFEVFEEGGTTRIQIGDPNVTVSGEQIYVVDYQLSGTLNAFASHDELFWNVTGNDWAVPIDDVSVTVRLPLTVGIEAFAACFEGRYAPTTCEVSGDGAIVEYRSTRALFPGEELTIVAGWPTGFVTVQAPILDDRPSIDDFFTLDWIEWFGVIVAAVAGLILLARVWWLWGRDRCYRTIYYLTDDPSEHTAPLFGGIPIVVEYLPPDDLRPAQMGVLVDERADTLDVTATIIDLAVRGHMTITEFEKSGWFGSADWELHRLDGNDEGLLPYERRLLDSLFEAGESVKVSALKTKFHEELAEVKREIYADAMERRWFAGDPERSRSMWVALALAWTVLGVGLVIVVGLVFSRGLMAVPLIVTGIIMIVLARSMARRTARGSEALRRVLGFKRYIVTAETRRQEFAEQANLFERYLPFAIVFECVDKWADAFAGLDDTIEASTSQWYSGASAFRIGAFTSGMGTFASSVSSTISSTPGGSGGSGFSGGSSGGGGGGGGGGSW